MKTYVINLLGGSGLGKSTTAAKVFGELKTRGEHSELVREFVKEWAWAGKIVGPFGQSIIYGQQLERESTLYNKVEFIVTDSPLVLCPVYQKHYAGHESIKHCVFNDLKVAQDMGVTHLNFLLRRQKPFDPRGRYEDEKTAKLIDRKVESFLVYHGLDFIPVDCPESDRIEFIVNKALEARGVSNDRKDMPVRQD
jgi:nicotinamide riboside kinase